MKKSFLSFRSLNQIGFFFLLFLLAQAYDLKAEVASISCSGVANPSDVCVALYLPHINSSDPNLRREKRWVAIRLQTGSCNQINSPSFKSPLSNRKSDPALERLCYAAPPNDAVETNTPTPTETPTETPPWWQSY